MSTSTLPLARQDGLYECTGLGETKFFEHGKPMPPGGCQACRDGSAIWLFCPNEALNKDNLLRVSIDVNCLPEGLYILIDDLFDEGDVINLKMQDVVGLNDGAYRITSAQDEGDSFHFTADKIGHKYWDPGAPLYHATKYPW